LYAATWMMAQCASSFSLFGAAVAAHSERRHCFFMARRLASLLSMKSRGMILSPFDASEDGSYFTGVLHSSSK
jgi:hypothetical protein